MMCVETFEVKNKDHFNSWDGWLDFVNKNKFHCEKYSKVWDFLGKCKEGDLPSEHPYWGYVVMEKSKKTLSRHRARYEECKIDQHKIKYYYNQDTTLKDIEKMILKLENEISHFENTLKY